MKTMEDLENQIEMLFDRAVDYTKTSIELTKLKAIDKSADLLASLISKAIIGVVFFFLLLFASLGLALWLGDSLGKPYLGFLIVAAFYGIIALFVRLVVNKWIKNLICGYIIKNALN